MKSELKAKRDKKKSIDDVNDGPINIDKDNHDEWLIECAYDFQESLFTGNGINCMHYDTQSFIDTVPVMKKYPNSKEMLDKIRDGAVNIFNKLYNSLSYGLSLYRSYSKQYKFDKEFEEYFLGMIKVKYYYMKCFIELILNYRRYIENKKEKEISYYEQLPEEIMSDMTQLLYHETLTYNNSKFDIYNFYHTCQHYIEKEDSEHFQDENGKPQFYGKVELFGHLEWFALEDLKFISEYIKAITLEFISKRTKIHPIIIQSFVKEIGFKLVTDICYDFIDTSGIIINENNVYLKRFVKTRK